MNKENKTHLPESVEEAAKSEATIGGKYIPLVYATFIKGYQYHQTHNSAEVERLKNALREIVDSLDKIYRSECYQADWHNNNTPGVGQTIAYMARPSMPIALQIASEALKETEK